MCTKESLQIDQKIDDEDWPLTILDHDDNVHLVTLKPGEMILYESAILPHGRPLALVGDYFDNFFVHFKPENFKEIDASVEKNEL